MMEYVVGQKVIVCDRIGSERISEVQRVTATQVIVDGTHYRKADCKRVGDSAAWFPQTIQPATEEMIKALILKIRRKELHEHITHQMERRSVKTYNIDQLERIQSILNEVKE